MRLRQWLTTMLIFGVIMGILPVMASAAPPVVKTVPWVATNPLIPHDTYATKSIKLKGATDVYGATILYSWDFGDGSAPVGGTVTAANMYELEASHVYTGPVGTVYTARLIVTNTATAETASKTYYVAMRDKSLDVEVNIAIDEGLWYLHKQQNRYTTSGIDYGRWNLGAYAGSDWPSNDALNINAFEVNGHLESGNADNPYTETVARGLRFLFTRLAAVAIPSSQTNALGTFNPDTNGNGLGVYPYNASNPFYQSGMIMDAIMASGTPDKVTTTGPANIIGRKYRDIVQDYADYLYFGQYDGGTATPPYGGGGWRYSANEWPDNSPCQWAAIGLIPWERVTGWGSPTAPVLNVPRTVIPQIVKDWNKVWLAYSYDGTGFGYTSPGYYPWGRYAVTPSGMVQMAMDGIGRGNAMWDNVETWMTNNFCNAGGPTNAVKDYYYGLFSFVKAMLLHDANGDGIAEPIAILQSTTPANNIDWYGAEASKGDRCDGVARTLVNDQNVLNGYWWGHNYDGTQQYFETAEAIIMLHGTIFEAGAPVAVAEATPNPAVAGQLISLSGAGSFHQDASKAMDSWEWDLDNNGTFEVSGVTTTISFPAVGSYPVKLRVTDNGSPEKSAVTTISILVTTPPVAPTANAGGPYNFCLAPAGAPQPGFFLDGSGSVNPDEGLHQPGSYPGDFIKSYLWDLDGDGVFDDASGAIPNVTAFFTGVGFGVGSYLIQLKVTDNTAASYPSSGYGDLSDTDSAQVKVLAANDLACGGCVSNLATRVRPGQATLTWTHTPVTNWDHYNVYRGTVSGGPYVKIAETKSTYSTYLDKGPLINGTTYYYVVREAALNGDELCQSNQASARPVGR